MKPQDFVPAVIVSGVIALLSVFIVNATVTKDSALTTRVEVVDPITKDFNFAGKSYFRKDSINPTREITIDTNTNTAPLNKR